ncbi:SHOCT domain-containing protein [Acidimangrovimonas sediminis]|uniref:SHOCT domain-containing protein n=1 Tax=Acidimangrovimonas sediminis TaxID=2056283 RepID=UPI000C809F14|nr:SHOCT domain-containing protein [Acidimangrovimonas sediminis]
MTRIAVYIALATALATGAARADAPGGYGPGYYGHPMMWGDGVGFFGIGMMVIFWGLIIGLVILAVRWMMERNGAPRGPAALDILKERLAKGEIDPEEYEARRKALEG